jgi:hypothetical protein
MADESSIKQSVTIPSSLSQQIQEAYLKKTGSAKGAIQAVMLRGAVLALRELQTEAAQTLSSHIPGDDSANSSTNANKSEISPDVSRDVHSAITAPDARPLTPLEEACIDRLLRILRSAKPGLPDAIISNLVQFEDFALLYERAGAMDQAPGHEGRKEIGVGGRDRRIGALERATDEIRERREDRAKRIEGYTRELEDTLPDRGRELPRQEGAPQPPSERGGPQVTPEQRELLEAAEWALQNADKTTANSVKGPLKGVLGEYRKWRKQEAARKREDDRRRETGT